MSTRAIPFRNGETFVTDSRVCYRVAMRLHITLDNDLVRHLDSRVGSRGRSAFIAQAVRQALENEHRWELIESALGRVADGGHEWDEDVAGWVRSQRRADERRVG